MWHTIGQKEWTCPSSVWLWWMHISPTKHVQDLTRHRMCFFFRLADQMIDHGRITRQQRRILQEADNVAASGRKRPASAPISSGIGPHLTPIKKRRSPDKYGKVSTFANQQRCSCCGMKTTWSCSECYLKDDKIISICHTRLRYSCWATHIKRHHEVFEGAHNTIVL